MLFLVILFISCLQGTYQDDRNPLGLDRSRQNVCTRLGTKAQVYYLIKTTTKFSYYTTSCGFMGWSRCGRSRSVTAYRSVPRTRTGYMTIIYCCSGWQQQNPQSKDCTKAICSQGCHSGRGSCVAPNNCTCYAGWTGYSCQSDLDECASSNGGCVQVCTNTYGSNQCSCNSGYIMNGSKCEDINECLTANGGCAQRCYNSLGNFTCGCYRGFHLITTNGTSSCKDTNECLSSNGFCTHQCHNTIGSYFCRCKPGFYLDSNGRTCSDHDECATGHHGCQHQCNNFHGSFYCSCQTGYALNKDNRTCSDVNECTPVYVAKLNSTIVLAGCDQLCHNTPGNYSCSCKQGYYLLYDGKRCRDVDECKAGTHSCKQICHNTPGSYGCSCFYGYKLRADSRSCEGLPCEAIMAPPHGNITCSGLVTNETCSFTCNDGYIIQGSERRSCLNSSRWEGQQTFCQVKSCGQLFPPMEGKVFLPCYFTFGSSCRFGCNHGFIAVGYNLATCQVTNSSGEVAWNVGNFTCEEIILCKPDPCRHGGRCTIINSRHFSCDCQRTGYEGDLCERGVVILPDFPKLIPGNPSERLVLQAKPDNLLTVHLNPTLNLTIQPEELTIQHPASEAEFQVTGHNSGVGMVSYDFEGVNKYDFTVPNNSFIFIGRNMSSRKSIYTRLGMLAGELPIGCQKKNIKNYSACDIRIAVNTNSTNSIVTVIESGPVHIITPENKTIPLTLAGYDFSKSYPSQKDEIMATLAKLINTNEQTNTDDQKPSTNGCSDNQLTAGDLIELIQKDALPKSFLRYLTDQLPLWLKVNVREDSDLFDIENTVANLVQTSDAHIIYPICKFPINIQSVVVLYRPTVNYSISVENNQVSLSSRGSCFASDVCGSGVFITLSQMTKTKLTTMLFMQDMANGGWELLVSSFGFTSPRSYNGIASTLPDGHMAENFSDFHYNWWWQGSAKIRLGDSSHAVNMTITGEAFSFAADLNAVFTRYFSQPIRCIFNGSVEFNITLQALGQRFFLTFYSSEVIGKAKFGGTAFLASSSSDDCRVPQGFVFSLTRSSKPFSASPLSNIIRPNVGLKYLQIYHTVTGGHVVSAQDNNNNFRFLQWQTQEIKRILLDVKTTVPELQSNTGRWEVLAEEMLTLVVEARRLLSSGSDWLKLKVLVKKLDDDLDIITRAFDLLVAQLQPYRNRTNTDSFINRFIRLKADLPKTIFLSFRTSSVQQNFVGLRFLLTAKVCHKRLCFSNIKSSIWSLHGNQCGTTQSRQEAGLLVEGAALQTISLGSLITFPTGGTLKMFLTRDRDLIVTTFESLVNLLGLKKNTTVRITGNKLSFVIWGHIFGEFDALLKVKAPIENVVDWNSILFAVEGTMNRSSRLYTLLEEMITNETTMVAKEATRRLANAQAAFIDAKRKADLVKNVLKSKQFAVNELKSEKEKASENLRVARLNYHKAKVQFNSTFYVDDNNRSLCEIQECNYTCLNGCVIPDLCQTPLTISYLEQRCHLVDKIVKVRLVKTEYITKTYTVEQFKTRYTGSCGSSSIEKIGGPIGVVVDTVVEVITILGEAIFGCSKTYERVPDVPKIVEYTDAVPVMKEVDRKVKEVDCPGHKQKTKPSGYGPPYQCCKQYGCQTKFIDSQCNANNNECEHSIKIKMATKNKDLRFKFQKLQTAVEEVKKATFIYEKARFRHQSADTLLKQVDAQMKQRLSAVEITNASVFHVGRMVDVGLKIAQAMNASDNKTIVDVGEMQFSFSTTSRNTREIVVQSNVSTFSGQRTPVSFLVDFDQVRRSISSASKTIIVKLFAGKHLRRKRSTPGASTFTHLLHSSFTDYPYACLFTNKTQLYLGEMCQSLGDLIASVKGLNVNLSIGFRELETLGATVNASSSISNTSSVNASSAYPNSSFVTEYLEMINFFKAENAMLRNDSYRSWNDTLETWRAFLDIFTSDKGFKECSGTQDCIEYFFEGAKEFYEFEDSARARMIKDALPRLKEVMKSLTTEALSMLEAEEALTRAKFLLEKTRDDSVLCGGTPRITSSSQGELILFPGDSLSLNCSAVKEEKLTYAWRRNDKLIGKSVEGTFYLDNVTKDNEGAYVCVVSNNKGSTLSNVTIVRVHSKPKITQHPQSQRVVFRSQMPAIFICNATAEPSPTFQWFFQSTNSSAIKIDEAKEVLYIANPSLHQDGYYYCEASNDHGTAVSQRARLDVLNYTVALQRLRIAFNITTQCWLTSTSNSSAHAHDPLPCEYESINALPASLDKNLTDSLLHSLARSLNVSIDLISKVEYYSRNNSKSSVAFIIEVYKEPWVEGNFRSYIDIVEAIAVAESNMIEKLQKFNSDVFNKTFKVSWNTTTLLGEPGSILVYPTAPECPEGQSLSGNGFICANCPAGSYYSVVNATCVECSLGTYQPVQGQNVCISCGKNLTTAFNGTVEEADCIADCPAGSYSTLNNTCILCPVGTYKPARGRLSQCISCGQELTTASNGTVDKMHCIKIEPPTSNIPTTGEQQSTTTASSITSSSSPSRILEVKLFFKGELVSLDVKNKEQILKLVEEEVSRFLSTVVGVTEKKSELSITEYGAKVVVFVNAADVDERRLQELLSEGIEIEYRGRKIRFIGEMTTLSPTRTPGPTKSAGEIKRQDGTEELPWKLPAIIVGPILVLIIIGLVGVFLLYRRRKIKKCKTRASAAPKFQFDNPTYATCEKLPEIQEEPFPSAEDSCSRTRSDDPKEQVTKKVGHDNPLYDRGVQLPAAVGAPGITEEAAY